MTQDRKFKHWGVFSETLTPFKKGIQLQREIFKQSMLNKDYETAVISLENIKAEIKELAIRKNNKNNIIRIQKILFWYKQIPLKYMQNTPDGMELKLPIDIDLKIQKNLHIAYELIIAQLRNLQLL